jgi:hypothetical protein
VVCRVGFSGPKIRSEECDDGYLSRR